MVPSFSSLGSIDVFAGLFTHIVDKRIERSQGADSLYVVQTRETFEESGGGSDMVNRTPVK
jgi:hypothetical protein